MAACSFCMGVINAPLGLFIGFMMLLCIFLWPLIYP